MTSTAVKAIAPEPFDIPSKDGLTVRGDVYRAENALGSVIVCHGFKGFARWAFFPYLSRALAGSGLTTIAFDFSGGSSPAFRIRSYSAHSLDSGIQKRT